MKSIFRREDGNALIESAIFMPVTILMLLAVLDFGLVLNQDLRVADSARSAAVSASDRYYATDTSVLQAVGTYSTYGIPNYKVAVLNYCTCANGTGTASCADHTSCGGYGIPNQYVKITATATLPLIFKVSSFPASINVQSVAIARTAWTGTN